MAGRLSRDLEGELNILATLGVSSGFRSSFAGFTFWLRIDLRRGRLSRVRLIRIAATYGLTWGRRVGRTRFFQKNRCGQTRRKDRCPQRRFCEALFRISVIFPFGPSKDLTWIEPSASFVAPWQSEVFTSSPATLNWVPAIPKSSAIIVVFMAVPSVKT
jgi:hypothetical protein